MKSIPVYILLLIFLVLPCTRSIAQQNISNLMIGNKYKADQYFLDLYYEQAIKYYVLALKKDANNDGIKLRIADCYRLLNEYERSLYWYAQVMENNPEDQKPINSYYYADMLLASGNYDEARTWYKAYEDLVPEDSRSERKLYGLDNASLFFIDSAATNVKLLPFNTYRSEASPVQYNNGLVFLSTRENVSLVDQDYLREADLYDLFWCPYDSTSGWGEVVIFDKELNTPYHEGPVAFFNGENELLLTRSNYINRRKTTGKDGKTNLQLYTADKAGNSWMNIKPFELDNPDYSIAHPALNQTNDTLFFSSDMPGGYGGTDIYMSIFSNGWSKPVNLGEIINTEGNELFPSYIPGRLYFTSDGHDGLGGLDIYKAVFEAGNVSSVSNLGYPVNSSKDDFSYSISPISKTGYFSSNRDGGFGSDDIYSFDQRFQVLNGIAIQEQDQTPIAGAQIQLMQDDQIIATTFTNDDGSFRFELPLSSDFSILATKAEHSFKTDVHITTRGSRVDIDTLLIAMHKHDFFARGLVYDHKTQDVIYDARVIIRNEKTNEIDTLFTGLDGSYSFVIEPGHDYILRAEKDRFSSDSVRINTHSISKGIITNDFLLEEEFIEKEIVYFDYDKFGLRDADIPVLQQVVDLARRYPNDWVIIGAHADSRGTKEYNLELSDKRARAVVNFLLTRGIKEERIIARGFGEGLILNRCVDGVNCREEDHSKNRRAEIRIEAKRPEDELENKGY